MLLPANRPSTRYLDFLVTLVPIPSKQPAPVQRDLVSRIRSMVLDYWDVAFSNAGLEKRILGAHWVTVAHRRGHVLGFAVGRHIENLWEAGEDVVVLDGVVVHPTYQRLGLALKLIAQGVVETARSRSGAFPLFFKPIPVVTRTASRQALTLGRRLLRGVVGPGFRPHPRRQRIIESVAVRLGWSVDDWNIDTRFDACLEDGDRFHDLMDHEALVVAGELTAPRWLFLQWRFAVHYPARYLLRARRQHRGMLPAPSAPGAHLAFGSASVPSASSSVPPRNLSTTSEFLALSRIGSAGVRRPPGKAQSPKPPRAVTTDPPVLPDPFLNQSSLATLDPFGG